MPWAVSGVAILIAIAALLCRWPRPTAAPDEKDVEERLEREREKVRRASLAEQQALHVELAAQMTARIEREKTERIEHLQQQAVRRFGRLELARGWQAWADGYHEARRRRRALRGAAARLLRPALASSLGAWRRSWEAALAAAAVQRVRRESAQHAEGAHAEITARLEREKEARIMHLHQQAARRIGRLAVARGWQTWANRISRGAPAAARSAWRGGASAAAAARGVVAVLAAVVGGGGRVGARRGAAPRSPRARRFAAA